MKPDMLRFFSLFLLHGYLTNGHDVITESISKTEGSPKSLTVSAFAFRESIARLSTRTDLFRQQRMHHDHVHEVTFVIQQRNMELLTSVLHDVSNPLSENYGQHMTKDEVTSMTSNPEAHKVATDYLLTVGAIINPEDVGIDYIRASASISLWEKTFDTHFFEFHQMQLNGNTEKFVRAEKYSIPMVLDVHVESVFNTIQMPYRLTGSLPKLTTPPAVTNAKSALVDPTATMTTPAKLKQFYNLTTQGSSNSTQCVYATINQYFSPSDLELFQKTFGLQSKAVAGSIGGHSSNARCVKSSDSCAEGNLDVQYMMAVSPDSPTTYWYSDLDFSAWLVTVAALSEPPLVLSISYGAEEDSVSTSELDAFNTEAIKLGSMGVSIVLASGDDGALSDNVRQSGQSACGYTPIFPASCPYIVAVGGTAGVDYGGVEVVAQGDNGQTFTSGGGFSKHFPQPDYQKAAVAQYFALSSSGNTAPPPASGYNAQGRGYPDVAFAGSAFAVYIGGMLYRVSGTSASAPAFGGVLSNINAARMAIGKGSVGWVNPALYMHSASFARDITSGDNLCCANGKCCPQGFYAIPGWDPVSGLGSVYYSSMETLFLSLGKSDRTDSPIVTSAIPTARPTFTPTRATYTYITVSQTVAGLTVTQAQAPTFTKALSRTISACIGLLATVSGVTVVSSQRRLLSVVTINYSIGVVSTFPANTILAKFKTAVDNGIFLSYLKQSSGVGILSVSGLVTTDISPSSTPTGSPIGSSSASSSTDISFVGTIAIIFSVIAALLLCCAVALMLFCRKWCKKRNASHVALSTIPPPTPATTIASAPPAYSPASSADYIPVSVSANAVGATPVMAVAQVQPCLSSRCRPPPPYATIHCTERGDEWQHNIGPTNH